MATPREAPIDADLPWGNVKTRRGHQTEQFFCRYCGRRGSDPQSISHADNCTIFRDPDHEPTDPDLIG